MKWPSTQPSPTDRLEISADRTSTIDRTAEDLMSGKFLLPEYSSHPEVDLAIRHFENNVRLLEEAADGTPVPRWRPTGQNDYLHAFNYMRIALEEGKHLTQLNTVYHAPVMLLSFTPKSSPSFSYLDVLQKSRKWRR